MSNMNTHLKCIKSYLTDGMQYRLMRLIILLIVLILTFVNAKGQSDSMKTAKIPAEEYAVYKYNPILKTDILTYQYSDLWDIDNDGIMDSLAFIGSSGAHKYFRFNIKLSSTNRWIRYPKFQIDMPYYKNPESINEIGGSFPQFAVYDFDNDGIKEIYLNIGNPYSSIPDKLKDKGITSKQIIIDYSDNTLVLKEFDK